MFVCSGDDLNLPLRHPLLGKVPAVIYNNLFQETLHKTVGIDDESSETEGKKTVKL